MRFSQPLVAGKLIERQKRFFAHCQLEDGSKVVAHCPNPGSMRGNLNPQSGVQLLDYGEQHLATGRKLRYKWLFVESEGIQVCVDTSSANTLVAEALAQGRIQDAHGYCEIIAEKKIGESRLDFYLPGKPNLYIEVKSVSMGKGNQGAFPDSVTERGQKHLRELMAIRASGNRAALLFLVMRADCKQMRVASEIDPKYAQLLQEARAAGVEVWVYNTQFDGRNFSVFERGTLL